jgi:hypothetical protein
VATAQSKTTGDEVAEQLFQAIRAVGQAPRPGARPLPVLQGLTPKGAFTQPQENVLLDAVSILVHSGRVYRYGDAVVLETERLDGGGSRLAPLRSGAKVETGAEDLLANLFLCQCGEVQLPVPRWLADLLLRSELLPGRLPQIRQYATRPVFDADFVLRGPGWHADAGILVHGPPIEPHLAPPASGGGPALGRLPPHLRTLLGGFCFRDDADLANAVGLLLTGLLVTVFAGDKPVAVVDGTQAGLGKSLLARVAGVVLDGTDPRLIHYTSDDEELQKRICATLRHAHQSLLLIDNAKTRAGGAVSSPAIEANSTAPEISLRILGTSETFSRPNDVLWILTMNDTRASPDLVSRGLPIRLAYEGRPEDRTFDGPDPIAYARRHRLDILGELAGMVVQWTLRGRPPGTRPHRFPVWAAVVGGILEAAGLPEFLANANEAAASFNAALDELAALAEAVVEGGGPFLEKRAREGRDASERIRDQAAPVPDWERFFHKAGVRTEELGGCKGRRAKSIRIGQFLSPLVGREVPIEVRGRTGRAVLRSVPGRSRTKRYVFEIVWDEPPSAEAAEPSAGVVAELERPTVRVGAVPADSPSGPPGAVSGGPRRDPGPHGNAEDW